MLGFRKWKVKYLCLFLQSCHFFALVLGFYVQQRYSARSSSPLQLSCLTQTFFFKGCYFTPLSSLLKKPFQWFCPHFPLQQIIFTTTQRVIHLSLFQLSLLLQAIIYRDIWERYQIAYSDILNHLQNMYTTYFFAVIVFFVLSCSNLTIMLIFFWLCSYYGHWKLAWVKSSHEKKVMG